MVLDLWIKTWKILIENHYFVHIVYCNFTTKVSTEIKLWSVLPKLWFSSPIGYFFRLSEVITATFQLLFRMNFLQRQLPVFGATFWCLLPLLEEIIFGNPDCDFWVPWNISNQIHLSKVVLFFDNTQSFQK